MLKCFYIKKVPVNLMIKKIYISGYLTIDLSIKQTDSFLLELFDNDMDGPLLFVSIAKEYTGCQKWGF